ncbi:MAG: cysteine hydrolase [Defluviitaleaceae bacterium]|nr:cysteine hydrolase [Defluviitaleaceae bacterium]
MKVLIVVDMQHDFIDGAIGTAEAVGIVPNVVRRLQNSRDELVIFTQDTHGSDYLSTPEGKKLTVPHCIKGTKGWEIHPDVLNACKSEKIIFQKPVFGSVEMVEFLKEKNPSEIEILGLCTDICVVSNAIMLKNVLPTAKINVNQSCCAGVTPRSHREALNTMKMCQIDII